MDDGLPTAPRERSPAAAPTGIPAVDAALTRLADLETTGLDGHVEIFDDVQRRLHEGLAELDDEQ